MMMPIQKEQTIQTPKMYSLNGLQNHKTIADNGIALKKPKMMSLGKNLEEIRPMRIDKNSNITAKASTAKAKALRHIAVADNNAKIDKAAEDFEAVFISQMLGHMFTESDSKDDAFGGGHAEEMYRSMLSEEYGKLIARTGGIGIASHVKREMLKMQEISK